MITESHGSCSSLAHVDRRYCEVAWSRTTLSMLPSFSSVSMPAPLCPLRCHLLSLCPCGVQGGWIMTSMLTRHTSNLHHPDTSDSCMSPPPHTAHSLPPTPFFCLSPPGTPAFLSASGSHKSANPPALLTALPQREREKG